MQETCLDKILSGKFEYEHDSLVFSEKKIDLIVHPGEKATGTFHIESSKEGILRGMISTSSPRLVCVNAEADERTATVQYSFDASGLEPGNVVRGVIFVISDAGEYRLPFSVSVVRNYLDSEEGRIRNLFHFTNLARRSFDEAVRVFYSRSFSEIFQDSDRRFLNEYRLYSVVPGSAANMEQFLIAVHKKSPVVFSTDVTKIELTDVSDDIEGEIRIRKSGWGYIHLDIDCDGDFIRAERYEYSAEDFSGDLLTIPYQIRYKDLHAGKNLGNLTISCTGTVIVIPFTLVCSSSENLQERLDKRRKQHIILELMRTYMQFRTHRIDVKKWCSRSMTLTEKLLRDDERDMEARLYMAQILLAEGRNREAGFILEHVRNNLALGGMPVEYTGYCDYLEALLNRDPDIVKSRAERVMEMLRRNPGSMRLTWLTLYLDESVAGDSEARLALIRKAFENGSRSPLLYIEALAALKDWPESWDVMDDFYIQTLWWGVRNGVMYESLVSRMVYLTLRKDGYSKILIRVLKAYYDTFHTEEIPEAVCTLLIRNARYGKEEFGWYSIGVDKSFKVTRLYESYLNSVPLDYDQLLPRQVLMYFGMKSGVSDERMALLYANMIRNQSRTADLLKENNEKILQFATRVAEQNVLSKNMSVVYEYAASLKEIENKDDFEKAIAPVIFRHRIRIPDKRVRNIIVAEDGIIPLKKAPVNEGRAYISIYGTEYSLAFEYADGRLSVPSPALKDRQMLRPAHFVHALTNFGTDRAGIAFYICGIGRRAASVNELNVDSARTIVSSDQIDPEIREEFRRELMRFLYEQDRIDELYELLSDAPIREFSSHTRSELVRYMVICGMHRNAYECVTTCGPEGVDPKILVRLVSRMIQEGVNTEDPRLLDLCFMVFRAGKYDEAMLNYLCENFHGTVRDMRDIWKASVGFDVDVMTIEERILNQMLYARSFVGEKDEIFTDYCKRGGRQKLIRAFLDYSSYEYFVKDRITSAEIFDTILRRLREGEQMSEICALALTKYAADPKRAPDTLRKELADVVSSLMERGLMFEYFRNYRKYVSALALFSDRTFIEYKASPRCKVVLHSLISGEGENVDEYKKEDMPDMYEGIYSENMVLFFGETLQYYVTEEIDGRSNLTESRSIERDVTRLDRNDSRYDLINDMLVCQSVGDIESLRGLMEQYINKSEIVSEVFRLR